MRGLTGYTMTVATVFSTILHFFALTFVDTFNLVPQGVTSRTTTLMVDFLPAEETVMFPREEARKSKPVEPATDVMQEPARIKEVKVKKDGETIKEKRTLQKETSAETEDEKRRIAAIKDIEKRVAGRGEAVTSSQIVEYGSMIQDLVRKVWVIPETLSGKKLEAVISIEIDGNGQVIGRWIEKSSGDLLYDQSGMRAISKAAPFPPPPGKEPIKIVITFIP